MAVTLNIATTKTLGELFQSGLSETVKEHLPKLNKCEIYYQTHCFDLLIELESNKMVVMRVKSSTVGALMSGMIGKQPLLDMTKGVNYFLKHVITLVYADSNYGGLVYQTETLSGQSCSAIISVCKNYHSFLVGQDEEKACPKAHKPPEAVPSQAEIKATTPLDLDFEKLEQAAVSGSESASTFTDAVNLGYGITNKTVQTMIADSEGHKEAPAVSLKVVTALGQKALGTSPNSVYYVAAMSPHYNLAYRAKNDNFSVRVEMPKGINLAKGCISAKKLEEAGLDVKYEGGNVAYASLHFEGMTYKSSKRVLGAIIADLAVFDVANILLTELIYE